MRQSEFLRLALMFPRSVIVQWDGTSDDPEFSLMLRVEGRIDHEYLTTQRGRVRRFRSLDTVFEFLVSVGVQSFDLAMGPSAFELEP